MRDVEVAAADGNKQAALALDVFAHRAKKYIGSFLAELGNCDAVVFTGGVGENGWEMREMILEGLAPLGIEFDKEKNQVRAKQNTCVSKNGSKIAIWVIPTNEELMIAQDYDESDILKLSELLKYTNRDWHRLYANRGFFIKSISFAD